MTHPTRTLAAVGATPSTVRIERELADLRDEITRRPPALVTLDTLDRLATAVEGLTRALGEKLEPEQGEPIGYAVAFRMSTDRRWETDGGWVRTLDEARDWLAREVRQYPDIPHQIVALVPVVTP